MRIEQLEYLAAIHEYHSMNLAGEKIHVSQQAISVAIRQLEEEFGMKLVHKTKQGSLLSPEGMQLLQLSQQFFADCEKLKNSKMQSALPTELIIAIPPGSEDVMWNHLFYYFFQNFPQIKLIRKYFNYTKSTKEYLLEHPSEVGITHVLPTELTDFGKQINYYHLDTCKLYFLSTNEEYRDLKTISINSIKNKHIIFKSNEEDIPISKKALLPYPHFWSVNHTIYQTSTDLMFSLLSSNQNSASIIPISKADFSVTSKNMKKMCYATNPSAQLNIIPLAESIEILLILCSVSKIPKVLLDYFHVTV